jgi:hypothetical protein
LDLSTHVCANSSLSDVPGVAAAGYGVTRSGDTVLVVGLRERVGHPAIRALVHGHTAKGHHVAVTSEGSSGCDNDRSRQVSYLGIGKWLFARFKMLPATFVLARVYYVSSTVAMIRSGHFFPLWFSPGRRRAVSVDDLIFT